MDIRTIKPGDLLTIIFRTRTDDQRLSLTPHSTHMDTDRAVVVTSAEPRDGGVSITYQPDPRGPYWCSHGCATLRDTPARFGVQAVRRTVRAA